mmetsp:Transcript_7786/g.18063  ORF Transcript_7786/g.18063 Transcript_7786/m.18063 type:complete len:209 (+) Transcript_7786:370-996(+)
MHRRSPERDTSAASPLAPYAPVHSRTGHQCLDARGVAAGTECALAVLLPTALRGGLLLLLRRLALLGVCERGGSATGAVSRTGASRGSCLQRLLSSFGTFEHVHQTQHTVCRDGRECRLFPLAPHHQRLDLLLCRIQSSARSGALKPGVLQGSLRRDTPFWLELKELGDEIRSCLGDSLEIRGIVLALDRHRVRLVVGVTHERRDTSQ